MKQAKMFVYAHESPETEYFFDQAGSPITSFSLNDADWRDEYMNCLMKHFGVEVVRIPYTAINRDEHRKMYDAAETNKEFAAAEKFIADQCKQYIKDYRPGKTLMEVFKDE